jgi:menaquinone-9 beta-reductase
MKPLRIFGGGLAGLSLGIALRQAGVPVRITEGADYPRHRVCGEFISGAGRDVLESFGLGDVLAGAASNARTAWFGGNRLLFSESLPAPALGLSRFQLDQRLARCFQEAGGELATRSPARTPPAGPGIIWACGRRGASHRWVGLKLHCRGLDVEHDLAMHLGTRGYVGVSRIEEGKMNICGLFHTRRDLSPGKANILLSYLRANGLDDLAGQIETAEIDPDSITATTALNFTNNPWPNESICIGDSNTAIPPFAGNGMSMALESTRAALPHLLSYAAGDRSWLETRDAVKRSFHQYFRVRLALARLLHPFLLHPPNHAPLSWLVSHRILPFNLVYRLLR